MHLPLPSVCVLLYFQDKCANTSEMRISVLRCATVIVVQEAAPRYLADGKKVVSLAYEYLEYVDGEPLL